MPVDNSLYDIHASGWWDENHFLHTLKTGINPARFDYFLQVLNRLTIKPANLKVLDVGCGGGILSEEFARLGCSTTGIDLSSASLKSAHDHAQSQQLSIRYQAASAVELPFAAASFEMVVCCDVLEHLHNPETAVSEACRVLKPGGVFLFDTINRTPQSFLETILVAQELPLTRFFAPRTHDWRQFIRPEEMTNYLRKHVLEPCETRGLRPGISPFQTAFNILLLKLGRINFAEFGRRLKFRHGGSLSGSYIGYAIKPS